MQQEAIEVGQYRDYEVTIEPGTDYVTAQEAMDQFTVEKVRVVVQL